MVNSSSSYHKEVEFDDDLTKVLNSLRFYLLQACLSGRYQHLHVTHLQGWTIKQYMKSTSLTVA